MTRHSYREKRTYPIKSILLIFLVLGSLIFIYHKNKQNNTIANIADFTGKVYKMTGSYSGDEPKDFNKIDWKPNKSTLSFSFLNNSEAFIGKYDKEILQYGWIMSIENGTEGYKRYKQKEFVVTKKYLNQKVKKSDLNKFKKLEEKTIPDIGKDTKNYYISTDFGVNSDIQEFRIYTNDSGDLIRQIKSKDSKMYYVLYKK